MHSLAPLILCFHGIFDWWISKITCRINLFSYLKDTEPMKKCFVFLNILTPWWKSLQVSLAKIWIYWKHHCDWLHPSCVKRTERLYHLTLVFTNLLAKPTNIIQKLFSNITQMCKTGEKSENNLHKLSFKNFSMYVYCDQLFRNFKVSLKVDPTKNCIVI